MHVIPAAKLKVGDNFVEPNKDIQIDFAGTTFHENCQNIPKQNRLKLPNVPRQNTPRKNCSKKTDKPVKDKIVPNKMLEKL